MSREPSPASGLGPSGFDPGRGIGITPIERAGDALKAAYEYIRGPNDPPFDAVPSGHRILALATAMVATEPLIAALRDIRAMRTPHANATVQRMADRAAIAMEARQGGDHGTGLHPKDDSAGRSDSEGIAPEQPQ